MRLASNISIHISAAALAAALIYSGAAGATPVSSLFTDGSNRMSDSSGEVALRYNSTDDVYEAVTGDLAAGDFLLAASEFGSEWTPPNGTPGQGGVDELTAISLIQVDGAPTPYATNGPCGGAATGLPAGHCAEFIMQAPTAAVFNAILTQFGLATISELDDDSVVAVFDDPANDYQRSSNSPLDLPTALGSATGGSLYFVLGLVDANGDSWSANAPTSIADFTGPDGQVKGNFGAQASVTYQNIPGVALDVLAFVDGTVSVPVSGNPPYTPYGVFDQSSITVTAERIPEPTTLSLIGLGFLGAGSARLRRRARASA